PWGRSELDQILAPDHCLARGTEERPKHRKTTAPESATARLPGKTSRRENPIGFWQVLLVPKPYLSGCAACGWLPVELPAWLARLPPRQSLSCPWPGAGLLQLACALLRPWPRPDPGCGWPYRPARSRCPAELPAGRRPRKQVL